MRHFGRPLALAALLSLPACPALAVEKLPPGHPGLLILSQADAGGTGFVARPAADTVVEARYREDLQGTMDSWARIIRFCGLPPGTKAFRPGQVISAYLKVLAAADANGDGDVTQAEIATLFAKEPDPVQRLDLTETFAALSSSSGTVTRAERDALAKADPGEVETLADKLADVEAKHAFEKSIVSKVFEGAADAEGRVRIKDVTGPEPAKPVEPRSPARP